jgi:membrane protease YdiL (CAAX protease family)
MSPALRGSSERRCVVRSGSILPLALTVEAVVLLVAFLVGYVLDTSPFGSFEIGWVAAGVAALALLPLGLLGWWSLRSRLAFLVKLRGLVFARVVPVLAGTSTLRILLLSLAAGICEEALFRGVLQTALANGTGPVAALAVVSLLFGLLHPVSPAYIVLAACLGAYLGGLLIVTSNLFVPIAVHAAYDFMAITLLLRSAPNAKDDAAGSGAEADFPISSG